MRKLLIAVGALCLGVGALICAGLSAAPRMVLPQGAITDGAEFNPVYKNPTPGKMPILAWGPFVDSTVNEPWFRMIRDSGVNIAMGLLTDTAKMSQAFRIARNTGLGLMVWTPWTLDPEKYPEYIRKIRNERSLVGYYLADELPASEFDKVRRKRDVIYSMDTTHLTFFNLLPVVGSDRTKTLTYKGYVEDCIEDINLPMVSYDNYPIHRQDGTIRVSDTFYENLQVVSEVAAEYDRPFWAFALVLQHYDYPEATIADLRYEIFNALAYGAQGICYFRFNMSENPELKSVIAPVMPDGKTTVVYDRMRRVNAEIQNFTNVFLGCRVVKLGHIGDIPKGCSALDGLPGPLTRLYADGNGILVSHVRNRGRNYIVIVNHDPVRPQTIRMEWTGTLRRVISNTGRKKVRAGSYRLSPGGYVIFTY